MGTHWLSHRKNLSLVLQMCGREKEAANVLVGAWRQARDNYHYLPSELERRSLLREMFGLADECTRILLEQEELEIALRIFCDSRSIEYAFNKQTLSRLDDQDQLKLRVLADRLDDLRKKYHMSVMAARSSIGGGAMLEDWATSEEYHRQLKRAQAAYISGLHSLIGDRSGNDTPTVGIDLDTLCDGTEVTIVFGMHRRVHFGGFSRIGSMDRYKVSHS